MIPKTLSQLCLLRFDLLARGVIGADQKIADDLSFRIAQGRDRHDRWETAAVLTDISQLVDVLDASRGLEHQRLEPRRDLGFEFDAERFRPRYDFLRIGNVGGRDPVHYLL